MTDFSQEFHARASRIPFLGLGLSVDLYSPNVLDLSAALNRHHLSAGYFEIFQAHRRALRTVRTHLPRIPMAYHAEGLWFTQPGWFGSKQASSRLSQIGQDLEVLDAWWVNQECATKEIAGRVFGTYVPPLFTGNSARLTAQQVWKAQEDLEARQWGTQGTPLLLLEVPPLTYFGIGDVSYPEFFRRVADGAPCGFVLDIGHVWTAYRYGGACRTKSFDEFIEVFLEEFPLERVIQIHVAGLACHPSVTVEKSRDLGVGPAPWVDSHPDPIPQDLFSALGKVLRDNRLCHIKGLALEVDNKAISLICRELEFVQEQFGEQLERIRLRGSGDRAISMDAERCHVDVENGNSLDFLRQELVREYADYLSLLTGDNVEAIAGKVAIPTESKEGVRVYVNQYLPQEILSWGGDLSEMFPRSCEVLKRHDLGLEQFLEFWFATPWSGEEMVYDFFLMKIRRFVDFVHSVLPDEAQEADQEADILLEGYRLSCQEVSLSGDPG
ncbi:MAG: DUF692 family multinuclear iron-containing protein [Nitrospirales bacterium]